MRRPSAIRREQDIETPDAGELQQEDQPKMFRHRLAGLVPLAKQAGLDVLGAVAEVCIASTRAGFLQGDSRRTLRPYLMIVAGLTHIGQMQSLVPEAATLQHIAGIALSALLVAVGVAARGRHEKLRVDIASSALVYLMLLQATWLLKTTPEVLPTAKTLEVVVAFTMFLHLLLGCGTHVACMLVWLVAVRTTCWLSNEPSVRGALLFLGTSMVALQCCLQFKEWNVSKERKEAEAQALRLSKLEKEAAQERQERIALCLSIVLRHLKAPILLLKSDVSMCNPEPEVAAQALKAFASRFNQLWSTFTGLETEIQTALGMDFDALSHSQDEQYQAAMQPQPVSLEAPAEETEAGSPIADRDAEVHEAEQGPRVAEQDQQHEVEGATETRAAKVPPKPVAEPETKLQWSKHQDTSHSSSSSSSSSSASSVHSSPSHSRRRRHHGPLKGLCGVQVGFDATDPSLRISVLTFHFSQDYLGDRCPGMYDLFPSCRDSFMGWVQEQIHARCEFMDEPGGIPADRRSFGRVTLSLPPLEPLLKLLLKPLLLMEKRSCCESLVAFKGLLSDDLEDVDSENGDKLLAVVDLSQFR